MSKGRLGSSIDSLSTENLQARISREDAHHLTVHESLAGAHPAQFSGTNRRYAASQRKIPLNYFYRKSRDTRYRTVASANAMKKAELITSRKLTITHSYLVISTDVRQSDW